MLSESIEKYIANHTSKEDKLLLELNRETHLNVLMPNMISGQIQGVFLTMLTQMLNPKSVLEIGTYTGYSAICMARGMSGESKLITIDVNEELGEMTAKYFAKAGLNHIIQPQIGNALEIIPKLDQEFDLVFIDADKVNYGRYYELVFPKLKKGGCILADNVLWKGKVADESKQDKDTQALRAFNQKVQEDSRVQNVILSVRDGLMLVRKL